MQDRKSETENLTYRLIERNSLIIWSMQEGPTKEVTTNGTDTITVKRQQTAERGRGEATDRRTIKSCLQFTQFINLDWYKKNLKITCEHHHFRYSRNKQLFSHLFPLATSIKNPLQINCHVTKTFEKQANRVIQPRYSLCKATFWVTTFHKKQTLPPNTIGVVPGICGCCDSYTFLHSLCASTPNSFLERLLSKSGKIRNIYSKWATVCFSS